jgi:hypothetical protein
MRFPFHGSNVSLHHRLLSFDTALVSNQRPFFSEASVEISRIVQRDAMTYRYRTS